MKKILLIALLFNISIFAECIHEKIITGNQLINLSQNHDVWVKNRYHQFLKFNPNLNIDWWIFRIYIIPSILKILVVIRHRADFAHLCQTVLRSERVLRPGTSPK